MSKKSYIGTEKKFFIGCCLLDICKLSLRDITSAFRSFCIKNRQVVTRYILACLFVQLIIIMPNWNGSAKASDLNEAIRRVIENIRQKQGHFADLISTEEIEFIWRLYNSRQFKPFWKNEQKNRQLLDFIEDIDEEGLSPQDYHLAALTHMKTSVKGIGLTDPTIFANYDILSTHSFVRVAYHLAFGKVDPVSLEPGWNFAMDISEIDTVDFIASGIESDDVEAFLRQFIPTHPIYTHLKQALFKYRKLEAAGGWGQVDADGTLRSGTIGPRVQDLKQRLMITGDLAKRSTISDDFDDDLEEAVRTFQTRHGLTADGLVGRETLDELNQPISKRIDQIRVNLERMRWFLHDIPATFLVVDIAGFHVYLVGEKKIIWSTKAMVGTPFRKTPSFRSEIEYLVFNPTWTIPPGILRKDIIPAIKKDPAYLERRDISVLDRTGKVLDRSTIDWSKYSARNFPFILRQEPGPNNALGLIKFIFPNRHFVFLHDTPNRNLFERTMRAFSSGCIRVDQPFTLAEHLLNDPTQWNQEMFQQIVDSGRSRTVFLSKPMTVLLLYWTVHAEAEGSVFFKKDIYGYDEVVLKELDGAFKIHKAHYQVLQL